VRVVSDSGPLIHLARAGHFDLLQLLYQRLLIPPSVYQEVAVRGRGKDGSRELSGAEWIHRHRPRRADIVAALGAFLGLGEAEAIALAAERKGTLLLIDEVQGRRVALKMGISVKGTLGLLLEGYRRRHVPDLKAAVLRMRDRGAWIEDEIVAATLAAAGER
jgi:predicted nucleic acid-binding protein